MVVDETMSAAPVSVAELKGFLRVDGTDEDALLAGLARSATGLCEAFTGLCLIERTVVERLVARPGAINLARRPVTGFDQAEAVAADGTTRPLDAAEYRFEIGPGQTGRFELQAPSVTGLRITYRAGLARDWNAVPEALRQGITRLVGHMYAQREDAGGAAPPAAVAALWRPWRQMRLG